MINEKFFDHDEIVRFGQPFHGLYRAGVISLPNSSTITPPAPLPIGSDGFAVMIPGQPSVTTSPADTAEGMEWLNYAIVSGENHVFYGIALGLDSWVYIADDNSAWKATASISQAGSGTVTLVNINDVTQTQSITVNCSPAISLSGTWETHVEDVATHGRRAAIAWHAPDRWSPPPAPGGYPFPWEYSPRYTRGLFVPRHADLAISGTPPNATATLSLVVTAGSEAGVEQQAVTISDTRAFADTYDENNVLILRTGGGVLEYTEVVSLIYDANNALQRVKKRSRETTTSYRMELIDGVYYYSGTYAFRRNLEAGSVIGDYRQSDYQWSGTVSAPQIITVGGWEQYGDGAIRYSNKAWGLYELSGADYRFVGAITFSATQSGTFSTGSGWPPVACAHPMSGALEMYADGDAVFM